MGWIKRSLFSPGFGILCLKNWARLLVILYAVLSSTQYLINSASLPKEQYPSEIVFLVMTLPLAIWISLVYIFTRPSIIQQFKGANITMETNEFEEQVDRDNPSNRKDIKTIGWGELSKLFLGAFTLYAIASHIFCPFTRSVNIYDPLIIYFVQFLFIYLFVSVPTVIIARVISKYRSIPMTELLYKTLLPTLIIGGILIYGGWYADNKMAGASRQSVEEGPRIAFSREGVRIDDKLVPLPCSLDQLSTALGKPSRRLLLANTILVWDRSGIMAYVKPGANNAQSISIAFWPTEYKYWPRTCFCDNVEIGTSFLNRKSKGSNLRAIGFVQNPMVPFYWERQFGSLLLTAETDLKGTKVVDVSLGVPMKKLSRRK